MFPFFKILEEDKSFKGYFLEKFKPDLNHKTFGSGC